MAPAIKRKIEDDADTESGHKPTIDTKAKHKPLIVSSIQFEKSFELLENEKNSTTTVTRS